MMSFLQFLVISWSLSTISFGFDLENTRLRAEKISRELHTILQENAGTQQLEKAYKTASCTTAITENPETFLDGLILSMEKRFNATHSALLNSKTLIESHSLEAGNNTHGKDDILLQDCCAHRHRPLPYVNRFHTEVNTSLACEKNTVSSSYNQSRKEALFHTFRNNFGISSAVSWQYFGSSQGKYLQFPSSPRVCISTNAFDPRFKSWYVNAASRAHMSVVLIIDRSGSMSGRRRMKLARQASLAVLETLGADESIGVLAFSSGVSTPSGCFGDVIAQANPSNIKQLKSWVKELQPYGGTKYVPAFIQAFKMLESVQRHNKTSVILFLTDGDAYDTDRKIYEAIRQGQEKMQNRTIINTYGLGDSLGYHSLQRLQTIANQNRGKFTHIRDSDASRLRSIMGQYYSEIPGTIRDSPVISLPHLDKDLGLVTTMSAVCLGWGNDVIGVVAQDVSVSELMKETVEFWARDGLSHVAVIDKKGRTIIHPSIAKPTDHLADPVFQPLSLYEPSVKEDVMLKITSGNAGSAKMKAYMSSSRGDPLTDGVQTVIVNATYMWKPVRGSPYIVLLVTANDHIQTAENLKFIALSPQTKSYYHRLDLKLNKTDHSTTPVCNMNGHLVSRLYSTVKLAPEAFNNSSLYVDMPETLTSVVTMETFFNDQSPQAMYPGLSESVRGEVMLTAQLEKSWNESEHRNPNMIEWRFVATSSGVFRVFPGIRLQKTYSHLKQPWYMRAVSNAGKLTLSRPSSNSSGAQMPGSSLSLVTTFSAPRCNKGIPSSSQIAGVIGIQLSQSSFGKILTRIPGLCDRSRQDCFIIDNSGYIVGDVLRPTMITTRHVTQMFPWLASSLASQGNFVKTSWCNNLEDHEVQLFHSLVLPDHGISAPIGSSPCRQYLLNPLPGTNAYLLVVRSRIMYGCDEITSLSECNRCKAKCSNCTGHPSPCQCPCSCSMRYDECTNSVTGLWTGIPCPASISEPRDTVVGKKANIDALMKVPPCPIPCESLTKEIDCNASRTCHWCRYSSLPTCGKICRTNQRIDLFVPFPCNDFYKLSSSQKSELEKSFIETLVKVSPQLTTKALDNPECSTTGMGVAIHGTTDGIPVTNHRDKIKEAIEAKTFSIGPTANVKRVYTARSSREYTNLLIKLVMSPWSIAPLTNEQTQEAKKSLQDALHRSLGESLASKARDVLLSKGVISFNLSNEGQFSRYPIEDIATNLTEKVQNNKLFIEIANTRVFATGISTVGSFDYYCNPTEPTSLPSVHPSDDSHLTLPPVTTSHTSPPVHTTTEEVKPNEETGLLPTEIYIVVFTALGLASCCPLLLFLAFRKRKKTDASPQTRTASPETEIEEDLTLEDSGQLLDESPPSYLPSNTSSFVTHSYSRRGTVESMQIVPDWSRARQQNPLQSSNQDKETFFQTSEKPHLEHRASLVVYKKSQISQEQTGRECFTSNNDGKRRVDWKKSVQKLQEKRRQEKRRLLDLSDKFSQNEADDLQSLASTNRGKTQNFATEAENEAANSNSWKKPPFKQGFVDCNVDRLIAENRNVSRPVRRGKYRRSQSNRDISMATFRILDHNTTRRQSFQLPRESNPQSLFGTQGGVPTLREQWKHDFDTTTRGKHTKPVEAWAKTKRPRLTSRNPSLI